MSFHTIDNSSLPVKSTSVEPRQILAESFCEKAQLYLLNRDYAQAEEFFNAAIKMDPENPKLYYAQGVSLSQFGCSENHVQALLLAAKSFKKATSLSSEYFEAWLSWATTLYELGKKTKEFHYCLQAKLKLEKAHPLLEEGSFDVRAGYYTQEALILSEIAKHSEESLDYQMALEAFEKTSSCKTPLPSSFWDAFGFHCLSFADKINDVRLFLKAIGCFKQAISSSHQEHTYWLHLADAFLKLFKQTHDEDHFGQANEAFNIASQIKADEGEIFLLWAQALLESGRNNRDMKRLRLSMEKAHRAYAHGINPAAVHCTLAEALACIGELSDRLDLIHEANNKLSVASEYDPDYPQINLSLYYCLKAFGKYFQEIDYFYQGIENLQEDLSLDRTLHHHWYLMGKTYVDVGMLDGDLSNFDKALKFFEKAIELQGNSLYFFDYAFALSKLGELSQSQPLLEQAVQEFEKAVNLQKNALYTHPHWLYHWGRTLDILGNFFDEEYYYVRALEIFSHVLMMDPDFPDLHHHIALTRTHLGDLTGDIDNFYKAIHHYRLASKYDEDNDQITLDWGVTLLSLSQHVHTVQEMDLLVKDAENKILQAVKLGNMQGHYYMACLHALLKNEESAFFFLEKGDKFNALPPTDDIVDDDWLDGIKHHEWFQQLITRLSSKENVQEER